jgi:S-DNA-T family DNA segregation ATPase FtsK/SpoIIIE
VGYGRGARLIDFMAEDGVVGQYAGSQAREVLITMEQWAERNGSAPLPPDPAPRKLKIQPHAAPAAASAPAVLDPDEEIDREEAFADFDSDEDADEDSDDDAEYEDDDSYDDADDE